MQFPDSIVFDLDGTLIDSAPDITAALNHTLETLSLPPVPEPSVRHMIGRGAKLLIERGIEAAGTTITPDGLEAAFATFLDYYGDHVADRSRPFDHVTTVLDRFAAEGIALGVATNKPQGLSDMVLEALDLARYFGAVLGADALERNKPHGDHIIETVKRLGRDPKSCVMIGDSETDVLAARDAGVPVVLVSFGYTTIPVEDLPGDALIHSFADLPEAVAQVFAAHK
jgi:phosphoglycolate phosphatase